MRLAIALVVLAALAAQAPGLGGGFVSDDVMLFEQSDLYTNPARLAEALSHPLGKQTSYWRPLATLSFLADAQVYGISATGMRLTNMLLHALTSVLALVALSRIAPLRWVATLGALLYAVHPLTHEAVTWPSGRFDVLAGLFVMAAIALVPRGGDRLGIGRQVALGVCAAAGFASKEFALVVPAVVLLWSLALDPPPARSGLAGFRGRWQASAAALAGTVTMLLVRYDTVGFVLRPGMTVGIELGGWLPRLLLIGRSVATFAASLAFPFGTVGPAHPCAVPVPPGDLHGWAGLLLLAAFGAVTVVALRRRMRVGWVLLALAISIAPVSQVVPLLVGGGVHASDRFLYVPLFFFVAACVLVVPVVWARMVPTNSRGHLAAAGLVVVCAAYKALFLLPHWHDQESYWSWCYAQSPGAAVSIGGMYTVSVDAGRLDDAERYARMLVENHPTRDTEALLAKVLMLRHRGSTALELLDRAVAARPDDAQLRLQRADILLGLERTPQAVQDLERAITIEEARADTVYRPLLASSLAASAAVLGRDRANSVRARERLDRALALVTPPDRDAWRRILRAALVLGDERVAADALARVGTLSQSELYGFRRLAGSRLPDSVVAKGLDERALDRARGRVESHPDDPLSHDRLAFLLFERGDPGGAEASLRRALELDAACAEARLHLGMLLARTGREAAARAEFARARTDAEAAGMVDLMPQIDGALDDLGR